MRAPGENTYELQRLATQSQQSRSGTAPAESTYRAARNSAPPMAAVTSDGGRHKRASRTLAIEPAHHLGSYAGWEHAERHCKGYISAAPQTRLAPIVSRKKTIRHNFAPESESAACCDSFGGRHGSVGTIWFWIFCWLVCWSARIGFLFGPCAQRPS
jgi:hypothetical protein